LLPVKSYTVAKVTVCPTNIAVSPKIVLTDSVLMFASPADTNLEVVELIVRVSKEPVFPERVLTDKELASLTEANNDTAVAESRDALVTVRVLTERELTSA
jgi:hypothetical protein